jgi:hypothetical protein
MSGPRPTTAGQRFPAAVPALKTMRGLIFARLSNYAERNRCARLVVRRICQIVEAM